MTVKDEDKLFLMDDAVGKPYYKMIEDPDYRFKFAAIKVKGKSLLDVGCANGAFLGYYCKVNPSIKRISGYDISQEALSATTLNARVNTIPKISDLEDDSVATVTCMRTLEYAEDPEALLKELYRITNLRLILVVAQERRIQDSQAKTIFNIYYLEKLLKDIINSEYEWYLINSTYENMSSDCYAIVINKRKNNVKKSKSKI